MIEVRRVSDIAIILRWRAEVIKHVFGVTATPDLLDANRKYYLQNIPTGRHIAVVASIDGVEAGCGAICLEAELPSPDNPGGRCAYLMNIYVREPFRNEGVAHEIVKWLVSEAQALGCGKIYLETTDAARPLYSSLGFRDMPDMMKLKQ